MHEHSARLECGFNTLLQSLFRASFVRQIVLYLYAAIPFMQPMSYSVDYRSNKEGTILIRTFSGVVKMADVISSWDYVLSKHNKSNESITDIPRIS